MAATISLAFLVLLLLFKLGNSIITYKTGPFSIVFAPEGPELLNIYNNGQLVWYTSADNSSFINAAQTTYQIQQNGGVYNINREILSSCDAAEIQSHGTQPSSSYPLVFFSGELCSAVRFFVSFQAVEVKDVMKNTYYHLLFNVTLLGPAAYNEVWLVYGSEVDEGFYGFGFQYSKLNMKGEVLPLFSTEQGVGRGLEPVTLILDIASKGSGKD